MQQDAIATIKDPERRAKCLWDIGQGLDANETIARYKDPAGAIAADAIGLNVNEAKMADMDWLEKYCGETSRRLKTPRVYEADALLYRKIDQTRREFKVKAQKLLDRVGHDQRGQFHRLVWKIVNVAHPKNWRVCAACNGAGMGPDGSQCPKCFYPKSGYRLEYEEGR